MNTLSYIGISLPPGIALVLYIYLVLRNNKKFGMLLIKTFIAGLISSSVLLLFLFLANKTGFDTFSGLIRTLIYAFIFVGFGSELAKFIVLRFYALSKPEVDTPVHGITFSVMTALGFATGSVLLFVFNIYEAKPPYPLNMYLLLAAPANIIFAIIMGFFVGTSKFVESRFLYAVGGLIAATFFNGLFKFCLITHDYKLLNIFAFGSALVVVVLIIRAINFRP
jgi:RsiW-degrading membrane proteinase PrsW (M82 family)